MIDFEKWWHETGSGIVAMPNHDHEEHAERVAQRAWDAASDPIDQRLIDELWQRRTDASEANARIQQLLGNTEQLRAERDEARRAVLNAMHPDLRNFYADAREWDCSNFDEKK